MNTDDKKNKYTIGKRKYQLGRDYKDLKIRVKKFSDKIILTNDYGKWCELSKTEYNNFRFGDFDENLFKKLEDSFMILTDKNIEKVSHQINDYYWYLGNGSSLHIIIPTLRCNFTCKYCYAFRSPLDKKDNDMTEELMDQTIDFIFKSPAPQYGIEFSGGEPLIRFDLVKRAILKSTENAKKYNKKLHFSIVTNGSYLNQEMIDFFKEHKVGICLSLDGPKDIHNNNRKITATGEGSYSAVIKAIDHLGNNEFPGVNAIPVITRDSLGRWKDIVDEYIKQGFTTLRWKYVSRFGFASKDWDNMSYTADEFLESYINVIEYMIELNKKGVKIVENITSIIMTKIKEAINPGYAELQIPCGAVIGQVTYNYDGSIYTCDEARTMPEFKIGDVRTSEYKDIIKCPISQTLHSNSNLLGSCDECPWYTFCGICPLEIYNEEKGFITNIPSNYRCKIHMGIFNYLFNKITTDPEAKKILYSWVSKLESDKKNNPVEANQKNKCI